MEREARTDERLDDLAGRMDAGFERVDRDIRDLRSEMSSRFIAVETGIMAEIDGLRQTMLRVGGALIGTMALGFLTVLTTILTSG